MRKLDWFIIGGVLLAAAAAFLALQLTKTPGTTVTVYVQGEVYMRVPADAYQTITIDQGDGKVNVIVIDESGVRMESSTCKNQLCVRQGTIDPSRVDDVFGSNWIVCLPNGVAIEVSDGEDAGG